MIVDVSVIIPAYNAGSTVGAAVESVLNMSVLPREIIVVDDGARDNTAYAADACRENAEKLGVELKIFTSEHSGVSSARNIGISHAGCEWMMFCDADDTVCEGWLDEMYTARSESRLAICGYSERGRNAVPEHGGECGISDMLQIYSLWLLNSCCNKIYYLPRIREFGISFDEDCAFGEDLDFNLRYLTGLDGFVLVDKVLYNYNPSDCRYGKLYRFRRQVRVYRRLKKFIDGTHELSGETLKRFKRIRRSALMYELKK